MTVIYFIFAVLALGILVLIHELGHFVAARAVGMMVDSFSIGFGPALVKKNIKGVEYRLGIIPFGGYVRIRGMERQKQDTTSVYEVPQGFFSKSPWKRIFVLVSGPLANVLLAIVAFGVLHLSGGRVRSFSEYTSILGWVHPSLQMQGVRLGDHIFSCNGKTYQGEKDAFTLALLEGRLAFQGEHPPYLGESSHAFSVDIPFDPNVEGPPCLGASYLICDRQFPEHSPVRIAGVKVGERLVWMDGELLFSPVQMAQLLNESCAFLRVARNGEEFLVRQPRVLAGSLYLSSHVRNELVDNQYEAGIKGKWSSLYILPYIINSYGYVEGILKAIDPDLSLPTSQLEPGDRILAVDGVPVTSNVDILRLVQDHKVSLIVQKLRDEVVLPVSESDARFLHSYDKDPLSQIVQTLGTEHAVKQVGDYRVLSVQPRPWIEVYSDQMLAPQRKVAKKIKNQDRRRQYLEKIESDKYRLSLGASLQDLPVKYNPQPMVLLLGTTQESLQTIKALIKGQLHPQWLSGPVGIMKLLHRGCASGFTEALYWIGLISMNLAVLNLLPIPVLDGGYIVVCLWEVVTRRRLNMKIVERILVPFMLILVAFFVFLTFQDLFRSFIG